MGWTRCLVSWPWSWVLIPQPCAGNRCSSERREVGDDVFRPGVRFCRRNPSPLRNARPLFAHKTSPRWSCGAQRVGFDPGSEEKIRAQDAPPQSGTRTDNDGSQQTSRSIVRPQELLCWPSTKAEAAPGGSVSAATPAWLDRELLVVSTLFPNNTGAKRPKSFGRKIWLRLPRRGVVFTPRRFPDLMTRCVFFFFFDGKRAASQQRSGCQTAGVSRKETRRRAKLLIRQDCGDVSDGRIWPLLTNRGVWEKNQTYYGL